jgi:hypothetical protein
MIMMPVVTQDYDPIWHHLMISQPNISSIASLVQESLCILGFLTAHLHLPICLSVHVVIQLLACRLVYVIASDESLSAAFFHVIRLF